MLAPNLSTLHVKIYADGAEINQILSLTNNPLIKGFTTNPSLMRAAKVEDYAAFAREVLAKVPNHPISFEVFADDLDEMEVQAREIASWGKNVYVKIPVTNTKSEPTDSLIALLSKDGIALNVTAVFTLDQVQNVADALDPNTPAVVSIFAGRIADAGVDPIPLMLESKKILQSRPKAELLWASCRELLNIVHAEQASCDIITVPHSMLAKLNLFGKNLEVYSLETVQMFYKDAQAAGYTIEVPALA
jgi:transaldolase